MLREVQDGAAAGDQSFRGVKIYRFFTAKRWKQDLFALHLSKVVAPGESFNEKQYLGLATIGFGVNFMREKKTSKSKKQIRIKKLEVRSDRCLPGAGDQVGRVGI